MQKLAKLQARSNVLNRTPVLLHQIRTQNCMRHKEDNAKGEHRICCRSTPPNAPPLCQRSPEKELKKKTHPHHLIQTSWGFSIQACLVRLSTDMKLVVTFVKTGFSSTPSLLGPAAINSIFSRNESS